MKELFKKLFESFLAVLPVTVVVIILAVTATDMTGSMIGLFCIGAFLIMIGMTFFTIGAEIAMIPIGNSIGSFVAKNKKIWLAVILCFVLGTIVTIAEPDVLVLSELLNSKAVLYAVALGVGVFLVISLLRNIFKIQLKYIFLVSYGLVFLLAIFVDRVNPEFLGFAFDSGGVTTGAITVPFLMSFGIGMASMSGKGEESHDNSFGLMALCSVGPIIAVLILGLSGKTNLVDAPVVVPEAINGFGGIIKEFASQLPEQLKDVAVSMSPIVAAFFIFQIFVLKLPKVQLIRIISGIFYTFIGVTLFLLGVNVGFMPMGSGIGEAIASSPYSWILIPAGMVAGSLIVLAEPAIHVLNEQIEQVTGGSISRKSMLIGLCTGVAAAVGLSMLRVLTGVSIWYFIVPVYAVSLLLSFFVPSIFTGIAFDSGGVASGSMTAAFLLPLALGACRAVGGNVYTDAYGLVAFVAMAPLITIQGMGLIYTVKMKKQAAKTKAITDSEYAHQSVEYTEEPVQFGEDIETEIITLNGDAALNENKDPKSGIANDDSGLAPNDIDENKARTDTADPKEAITENTVVQDSPKEVEADAQSIAGTESETANVKGETTGAASGGKQKKTQAFKIEE